MRYLDRISSRLNASPADRAIARALGITIEELAATSPTDRAIAKVGRQFDAIIRRGHHDHHTD